MRFLSTPCAPENDQTETIQAVVTVHPDQALLPAALYAYVEDFLGLLRDVDVGGVNVTTGLGNERISYLRGSVDHGTAEDAAWKKDQFPSAESLNDAFRVVGRMAFERRKRLFFQAHFFGLDETIAVLSRKSS